jgi:3-dehydroquinate dehydratase I
MNEILLGKLRIGNSPKVVGTISRPDALPGAINSYSSICDILEIRYDNIGGDLNLVLNACGAFEQNGLPVIFTTRLESEGGRWVKDDLSRRVLFEKAIDIVSAVDIEYESELFPELCNTVKDSGKSIVVSYHDFDHTPDVSMLTGILKQISEFVPGIAKISTKINSQDDIKTLLALLEVDVGIPTCIIGMGPLGTHTRVSFPNLGSCFTYGYIDKSSAPGQLHCSRLTEELRGLNPAYNEDVIIRKQILEYA